MSNPQLMTASAATEAAPGWRVVCGKLQLLLDCGSFAAAVALVDEVARLAEERNHHPDVDLRYRRVRLVLVSHEAGGITEADIELANAIWEVARTRGHTAEHSSASDLELGIDTMDADRIRPFWAAVLGYSERRGDLVDPLGVGPTIWFQQMDEPRPQRNRIHLDFHLPHDLVPARLEAAQAAGGRIVRDAEAPSWWVLADPDGNEVCLCTWQDRD